MYLQAVKTYFNTLDVLCNSKRGYDALKEGYARLKAVILANLTLYDVIH